MRHDGRPGWIVILNGAPRSGKSRIAAAVQTGSGGVWMNVGVDHVMRTTPEHLLPGIGLRPGGERPDLEPHVVTMYHAMYDSIAAHSRLGLNVVVDVGHHDAYSRPLNILPECARRLAGLPALFVGVRCPVEVIRERRRATWGSSGDAAKILAWQREVHLPGLYDLEVDTSKLSPEACAGEVRRRLDDGPPPRALAELAVMSPPAEQ